MINGKKVIAIIPARAGSKRVINKNVRDVCGTPLIGWTLKDLSKSKYIDHSFVSTDSADIQKLAKTFSVDCDQLRPAELATDTTTSVDVVLNVLENKPGYDLLVLLQPTSPLRTVEEIDKALEFYFEKSAHSVTSVCETESHPSWASPLPANHSIEGLLKNLQSKRSQDLEVNYRLNGAIYIIDTKIFQAEKSFFAKNSAYAFVMSKMHSVDIDTEEDLLIATALIKSLK